MAHERRLSRESIRYMDDVVAASGVQGEMVEHGGKKKKKKDTVKIEPVGFNRHYDKRLKEGYPNRQDWERLKHDKNVREFTKSIDRHDDFAKLETLGDDPLGGGLGYATDGDNL